MKFSILIIFSFLIVQSILAQNEEWINYTYNENIQSIVGKNDILWLATSGGLVKFNIKTEEKEYFNVSNSDLISNDGSPIALDSLGNVWMWIGYKRALSFHNISTDYLVKFDGADFTYFRPEISTNKTLDLFPRVIEIDRNNEIWIGTSQYGVLNFDGNNWNSYDTTNSPLPTNSITDISVDKENNKWLGSEELSGLIKFNNSAWEIFDSTNSPCPNMPIFNVETDNNGKLWLSTYKKIISVTDTAWEIHQDIIPEYTYIPPNSLKFDNNNEPWFLDNNLYHLSSNGLKTYPLEPDFQFYYTSAFFIDNNNNKWMNSKRQTMEGYEDYFKGGLAKFDSTSWSIYSLSNSKFKGNGVGAIFRDSKNNIWLGSKILTKINNNNSWTYYSPKFYDYPRNNITAINEDNDGNMWFGTYGDGLLKFDGTNWVKFDTGNSTIPNNLVFDIDFDNKGNIWFTTDWQLGLVKFDGTNFTVYDTTNSGIPTNYLHQVESDSEGNIWVGAVDKGLVKFDQNTWTLYSEQIKWNEVSGLFIDDEDCIWIGGFGLTSFKDGNWNYFEHDDSIGYYWNLITNITKDSQNNIWVVARYGLYKFEGNNWQKFDHTNAGLPDEFLRGLEIDQFGNLWVGTSSGVILYKEGGVVTEVNEAITSTIIDTFELFQNYPNPFNPTTTIKYSVPLEVKSQKSKVKNVMLKIYDILGREVSTLVNQKQKPGIYEVAWEASKQPSGIYFYQLTAGDFRETRKMILLK